MSWLALMKVVVSGVPFHKTAVPFTNPEPFADRTNAAPPAVAELGEMLDRVS